MRPLSFENGDELVRPHITRVFSPLVFRQARLPLIFGRVLRCGLAVQGRRESRSLRPLFPVRQFPAPAACCDQNARLSEVVAMRRTRHADLPFGNAATTDLNRRKRGGCLKPTKHISWHAQHGRAPDIAAFVISVSDSYGIQTARYNAPYGGPKTITCGPIPTSAGEYS